MPRQTAGARRRLAGLALSTAALPEKLGASWGGPRPIRSWTGGPPASSTPPSLRFESCLGGVHLHSSRGPVHHGEDDWTSAGETVKSWRRTGQWSCTDLDANSTEAMGPRDHPSAAINTFILPPSFASSSPCALSSSSTTTQC